MKHVRAIGDDGELVCAIGGENIVLHISEIKKLVSNSTKICEENISVIFSDEDHYKYSSNKSNRYMQENIYTNGNITETFHETIFNNFSIIIIIKQSLKIDQKNVLIVIKEDGNSSDILQYLNPDVLMMLI